RQVAPGVASRAIRHLRRPQLPPPVGRARNRGGGGEAVVRVRPARPGQGPARGRIGQAGPHLPPALTRNAGGEWNPCRARIESHRRAVGGGIRAHRGPARSAATDYVGGAFLASCSGVTPWIVTGLVNSSEFGTMITTSSVRTFRLSSCSLAMRAAKRAAIRKPNRTTSPSATNNRFVAPGSMTIPVPPVRAANVILRSRLLPARRAPRPRQRPHPQPAPRLRRPAAPLRPSSRPCARSSQRALRYRP